MMNIEKGSKILKLELIYIKSEPDNKFKWAYLEKSRKDGVIVYYWPDSPNLICNFFYPFSLASYFWNLSNNNHLTELVNHDLMDFS